MIHAYRHVVFYNRSRSEIDHNLFEIIPFKKKQTKLLVAQLSSTITILMKELYGRQYGGGSGPIKTEGIDIEKLLLINPGLIDRKAKTKIEKAFTKLAAREINAVFDEVNQKDRRELDNIFFDILDFTKKERQEIYDAVCELVRNRLEKAKTFGRNVKSKKDNFNSGTYADHILSEVYTSKEKKKFPDNFIDPSWITQTIELPKIEDKSKLRIEEFFGKASLKIEGQAIDCGTTPKARYVELAIQKGVKDRVVVPADDGNAIRAVNDYLKYREMMKAEIEETMKMFNLNKRQTKAVLKELEDKF